VNPHWYTPTAYLLQGGGAVGQVIQNVPLDPAMTIEVAEIKTKRLTVGTAEAPTGVTLFDLQTRQPKCLVIESDQVRSYPGRCEDYQFGAPLANPESTEGLTPPADVNGSSTTTDGNVSSGENAGNTSEEGSGEDAEGGALTEENSGSDSTGGESEGTIENPPTDETPQPEDVSDSPSSESGAEES